MVQARLTTPKKHAVVSSMLTKMDKGSLVSGHGITRDVAREFGVSDRTVRNIFSQYKQQIEEGVSTPDMGTKRHKSGRKLQLTGSLRSDIESILQDFADQCRYCSIDRLLGHLQELGHKLGRSTLHEYLERMQSTTTKLWLKSQLNDTQRRRRLDFVLSQRDSGHGADYHRWKNKLNEIHIDESWFYIRNEQTKLRLTPDTKLPDVPTTVSKGFITKVMFIVAMARPRKLESGEWFDGKIGLWPVVKRVLAKRNSKNRAKGDECIQEVSVTAESYREFMVKEGGIFDAIKEKMPWMKGKPIIIQHDGAKPHDGNGNKDFLNDEGCKEGWNISIVTQPPQSPDLNILDLGFFNGLKKRIHGDYAMAKNRDELMEGVRKAYEAYPRESLDHIWAHLFDCYQEILKCNGGNQYKAPHSRLRKMGKNEDTAVNLKYDEKLYLAARKIAESDSNM